MYLRERATADFQLLFLLAMHQSKFPFILIAVTLVLSEEKFPIKQTLNSLKHDPHL